MRCKHREEHEHQQSYLKPFLKKVTFLTLFQHTRLSIPLEFCFPAAFYKFPISCQDFFAQDEKSLLLWPSSHVFFFLLRLSDVQTDLERLRFTASSFDVRRFPLKVCIMQAFNWCSAQRLLPFKNGNPGEIFIFRSDIKDELSGGVVRLLKMNNHTHLS